MIMIMQKSTTAHGHCKITSSTILLMIVVMILILVMILMMIMMIAMMMMYDAMSRFLMKVLMILVMHYYTTIKWSNCSFASNQSGITDADDKLHEV